MSECRIDSQYAHDVVLTSVRRPFNVMDVVWLSKRCRVLTGLLYKKITPFLPALRQKVIKQKYFIYCSLFNNMTG